MRNSLLSLVADAYVVPLMRVCVVVGVLCSSLLCSSLRILFLNVLSTGWLKFKHPISDDGCVSVSVGWIQISSYHLIMDNVQKDIETVVEITQLELTELQISKIPQSRKTKYAV
jgi:hypothetical protein